MTEPHTVAALTGEMIAAAVRRYLDAVTSGTAQDIAACYSVEGTLEDPVGSSLRHGRSEIAEFYRPLEPHRRETELRELHVRGAEAAFAFTVVMTLPDGTRATTEVIDVMRFSGAGEITSMRAFWQDDQVTLARA